MNDKYVSDFWWIAHIRKEILMYKRRKNRQKSLLCASNPYLHSHCASLFMTHWGPFSGVIAGAGPLKWEQQPRYMQPCQAPRVSLGQLETRGTLDRNKWPGLTFNVKVLWFSRALKLLKPWKFWEFFLFLLHANSLGPSDDPWSYPPTLLIRGIEEQPDNQIMLLALREDHPFFIAEQRKDTGIELWTRNGPLPQFITSCQTRWDLMGKSQTHKKFCLRTPGLLSKIS